MATLTSKGQMTLPKDVRERFNLKAGDKLDVVVQGQQILLVPATLHVRDLRAVLPKPAVKASQEDVDATIRKRAARSR